MTPHAHTFASRNNRKTNEQLAVNNRWQKDVGIFKFRLQLVNCQCSRPNEKATAIDDRKTARDWNGQRLRKEL